jgi:hypothetical protein
VTADEPVGPTLASFEPHLGSGFTVHIGAETAPPLRLDEATRLPVRPQAPRPEAFSLVFSGAPPALEQRTYVLRHPALGAMDIFLVPIGVEPDGRIRYEAVFN